jgi:hypothetical protein
MRKYLSLALVLLFTWTTTSVPAYSAVKIGAACKSVGQKTTLNGSTLICTKSGSKLVWSKSSKADSYDAAFANAFLAVAKRNAAKIIEDAKTKAAQISSPPYCTTRNSIVSVSLGPDGIDNLLSLIFNNPGFCDVTVRASAAFLCPDGGVAKTNNYVTSTGIFPLRAGQKIPISLNVSYYFPQVLNECRLLTGYSTNSVRISTYHQSPSVMTLTSNYSGDFNQFEATEKANQFIASEKARADKIIADAKNPVFLAKAWKFFTEKEAADKAAADKAAADKAAVDADRGKVCVPGGSCKVGNTGPAGGIVFYDAGSQQSWGRYLEVAPQGWSGSTEDPEANWCPVKTFLSTQVGIGYGKSNTDLMMTGCTTGAAVMARSFKGGGKSDWFLPSKDELNELYKYARSAPGGTLLASFSLRSSYWTSSESSNMATVWKQEFEIGQQTFHADIPRAFGILRPIRSF